MAAVRLWVFVVMHNEAPLLGYWLRHYAPIADRVVIFDDHSDDGTPELAASLGADVRPYPGAGLDDQEFVDFAAATYPEARGHADFVIWVDADEFIYHPNLCGLLARYSADGVTLPRVQGYAMYSETFPVGEGQIYDECAIGVRADFYSKPVVFNPALELAWIPGKHGLTVGHDAVRSQTAELKMLHYRHLGRAYFEGRNQRNYQRMTDRNVARGYGYQTYDANMATHGWDAEQVKFVERRDVL